LAGAVLSLMLVLVLADALLAGPLRRWTERGMNASLVGYTVRLGRFRPHLWRLGFELDDLVLVQTRHPDPPVADFGAIRFFLLWRELLRLRLAGDLTLERPALHINLVQIREEMDSHVRLRDRGWQRAVETVIPIEKLDRMKIRDGSLLYLSSRFAQKPLQFTGISMDARNIHNMAVARGVYPSPVTLDGVLFGTGKVQFSGAADFLREPYFGARGELRLERIPLDRLEPFGQEFQLKSTGGYLSVSGSLESNPELKMAHLAKVLIEGLRVDYIASDATKAVAAEHAEEAIRLAQSVRNAPKLALQVDTFSLSDSQIGFVDEAAKPSYRLFLSGLDLEVESLGNQAGQGRSRFQARGAFMGNAATVVSGGFQSTAGPLDFDVHLQLDDAQLPALNDFLLAHAGVDVAEGRFSVYTEIAVKNGQVNGYVKPLVWDLKISDRRKDQAKPFGKRVEMHLLQFLAGILKNHSSQKVATIITVSGSTSHPKSGEWKAIRRLIGNGLAHAIVSGFVARSGTAPEAPKGGPAAGAGQSSLLPAATQSGR